MTYLFLAVAIIAEVVATSALKASAQFTRLTPSLVVVVGYGLAFYFLTLVLKSLPLGITYAVWSGLGVVLVTMAGFFLYRQVPDAAAIIGICLIAAGVVIIRLFSRTLDH